jgi:diguanylate cyclase (GGDEF)-like protein
MTMTVGSAVHTAGIPNGEISAVTPDQQGLLLAELVAFMTKDTPSLQHVLDLAEPHLRTIAGLTAATIFELDSETGMMTATAQTGEPGRRDAMVAGKVFRTPAGGKPVVNGEQMAIRLRIGGNTVGVLLLTGADLDALRPETTATMALHFATTLQGLSAEKHRQFVAHSSSTIRELFEQGMAAASVETAAELLARSCATAFRTEQAGMHLVDAEGRIRYVHGVGFDGAVNRELSTTLIGAKAAESPVWRAIAESGEPLLVADAATARTRTGGFVQSLGAKSFIAIPLMSGSGPVGMVVCGDRTGTREWSSRDRILAQQLAVEGALIIDSARMRQASQAHMNELTHQAYHDSLTGLPNRKFLLDRAEQAVEIGYATGTRVALLLLDLNGFKQVNDTVGHHAGDVLLQLVAQRLQGSVRRPDLVARLGGDEFAVLLTANPGGTDAVAAGERICDRLREPFDIEGQEVRIGASIGVAICPQHAIEFSALMRAADVAMYDVKRAGGGVRLAEA